MSDRSMRSEVDRAPGSTSDASVRSRSESVGPELLGVASRGRRGSTPAKRGQLNTFKALVPERQGHNLALTVFLVPHSLDSVKADMSD